MVLTNKSRSAIYNGLTDIIEEEALEEMLTNFPAREIDEPVTRDFLAAQMSDLRGEMTQMEGRLSSDTHKLRNEMSERFASQTRWMAGMVIAIPSVTVALQAYFG